MLNPFVLGAWTVAVVCVAVAASQRAKVERLAPPPGPELLRELLAGYGELANSDESARPLIIAELNERLSDVSFGLQQLPATFTALIRISLASGTALALFGFLASGDSTALARAVRLGLAAVGGLLGASTVGMIGRMANRRGRELRERWDHASREVGKVVGASLEGPVGGEAASVRRVTQ